MSPSEKIRARQLWGQLCCVSIGVDEYGSAVERITTFGTVATASALPLCLRQSETGPAQEEAEQIAQWLEDWAKRIRGKESV